MKFGVWTPLPHTVRDEPIMAKAIAESEHQGGPQEPALAFKFVLEALQKAESYGFGITLIAQRFLGPDLDSWMMSAALASRTKTIEIMPAVHPGIITPQVVAKLGATLDQISGGRFAVNVVNGWFEQEFNMFGNGSWLKNPENRYRRMEEFTRIIRGLWEKDRLDFSGSYYQVQDGQLPSRPRQPSSPPIYATSNSETGKDIIARYCDVWFLSNGQNMEQTAHVGPEQYEDNIQRMARDIDDMRQRAASVGREVKFGLSAFVVCGDTDEQVRAEIDGHVAYSKLSKIHHVRTNGMASGLIGTPETIARRIERLRDIGVEVLMLKFSPVLAGIESFSQRVMPLLDANIRPPQLAKEERRTEALAG